MTSDKEELCFSDCCLTLMLLLAGIVCCVVSFLPNSKPQSKASCVGWLCTNTCTAARSPSGVGWRIEEQQKWEILRIKIKDRNMTMCCLFFWNALLLFHSKYEGVYIENIWLRKVLSFHGSIRFLVTRCWKGGESRETTSKWRQGLVIIVVQYKEKTKPYSIRNQDFSWVTSGFLLQILFTWCGIPGKRSFLSSDLGKLIMSHRPCVCTGCWPGHAVGYGHT